MTKQIKTSLSKIIAVVFTIALLVPLFAVGCTDEAKIVSIEVYPTNFQAAVGQTGQFFATATYSNGSSYQVTGKAIWSSSNSTVATISDGGTIEASAVGTATITAVFEGHTDSAAITVSVLPPTEITIVDSAGRSVVIPQPLTSIVVLHSDAAGAVQALQSTDIVVGISSSTSGNTDDYPLLCDLTPCGSSYTPNYEQIIELNPQVVIAYVGASGYGQPASEWDTHLAGTDIKVVGLDFYNPSTLCRDMSTLGVMLGKEERASEYVSVVQGMFDAVTTTVKSLNASQKQKVYFESWTDWKTAAEGSGWHDMIVMVGGINIYAGAGVSYPVASAEFVLNESPRLVVKQASSSGTMLGSGVTDTTQAQAALDVLLSRSGWDSLPAVVNDSVYLVSSQICGGFGKPICIEYLAKILYPDKFASFDPVAFHQWYCDFQGIEYEGVHIYPTPSW